MDDQLHNEEMLMRYLDGELAEQERVALEARLESDEALQQQLLNLRVAVQAIRQYGTAQTVAALHPQMMQGLKRSAEKPKVVSISRTVRLTMAVAASLLILFIGFRVYEATQLSADKLYSESFVDFDVSATRNAAAATSTFETLYRQKDYSGVIRLNSDTISSKALLLVGLSYLHVDQPLKAVEKFNSLTLKENDYRQDAEFYSSLAYLKLKEYSKALPLMQKISGDASHLYHHQFSRDFVERVEKLKSK
jgi:tetratricopeptide (TPR) repeat protein